MRILIFSPSSGAGKRSFMHGSPAYGFGAGLGVNVAPSVGRGGIVAVNAGVFVIVTVGGIVAVGMAA